MQHSTIPIILASASPARLKLLHQIKIIPDQILPADIDETEKRGELPGNLARRLAYEKAVAASEKIDYGVIIAGDTVSTVGRRILPKALTNEDVKYSLTLMSQRRHRIYTGVCIIKKVKDEIKCSQKLVMTTVKFKKLTSKEIEFYCQTNEGLNKAGGYSIMGYGGSFVSFISGSFSNVAGLPLFETLNMLNSFGVFPQHDVPN